MAGLVIVWALRRTATGFDVRAQSIDVADLIAGHGGRACPILTDTVRSSPPPDPLTAEWRSPVTHVDVVADDRLADWVALHWSEPWMRKAVRECWNFRKLLHATARIAVASTFEREHLRRTLYGQPRTFITPNAATEISDTYPIGDDASAWVTSAPPVSTVALTSPPSPRRPDPEHAWVVFDCHGVRCVIRSARHTRQSCLAAGDVDEMIAVISDENWLSRPHSSRSIGLTNLTLTAINDLTLLRPGRQLLPRAVHRGWHRTLRAYAQHAARTVALPPGMLQPTVTLAPGFRPRPSYAAPALGPAAWTAAWARALPSGLLHPTLPAQTSRVLARDRVAPMVICAPANPYGGASHG